MRSRASVPVARQRGDQVAAGAERRLARAAGRGDGSARSGHRSPCGASPRHPRAGVPGPREAPQHWGTEPDGEVAGRFPPHPGGPLAESSGFPGHAPALGCPPRVSPSPLAPHLVWGWHTPLQSRVPGGFPSRGGGGRAARRAPGGAGNRALARWRGTPRSEPPSTERSGASAVSVGATRGPLLPPRGGHLRWQAGRRRRSERRVWAGLGGQLRGGSERGKGGKALGRHPPPETCGAGGDGGRDTHVVLEEAKRPCGPEPPFPEPLLLAARLPGEPGDGGMLSAGTGAGASGAHTGDPRRGRRRRCPRALPPFSAFHLNSRSGCPS